uniref:Uncharacterized protein n=1 Tax=Anguilla anguilla TaxID=7936 RepID=A0A0E9UJL2_ANGAN
MDYKQSYIYLCSCAT